tara:strand:- start:230 stop:394 length:165 start_codon:yes stop_codon:yes gene_type:complete
MSRSQILEQRIDDHEKLCLEKYDNIKSRLVRIEAILIGSTASVIALLIKISIFN